MNGHMRYKETWKDSNDNFCDTKKVFYTWKQAQTFNNSVFKRGSSIRAKGKKIERLHVYQCKKCQHFHIGHGARDKSF